MGAKQGLAAGSWWEQRQGSGRRRAGLQQQQQATLEGRQGQGSRVAYRDEARKSDEGQTGGPEAAGGARDQCPDPSGW